MESLDLSVCLRPVWARALRCYGEGLTGVAPQEGPVGATVVRQNPLDRDAEFGEPLHSAVQHPDGRDGGLASCTSVYATREWSSMIVCTKAYPSFGLPHLLFGLSGVAERFF